MSYLYVLLTIVLTVYGQLVIKWQVSKVGPLPESVFEQLRYLFGLLGNPWIISAYAAALLASLAWVAAMSKLDLSHAYPFMSLAFVLVMVFSALFFNEPLTVHKLLGIGLVVFGLVVGSQG